MSHVPVPTTPFAHFRFSCHFPRNVGSNLHDACNSNAFVDNRNEWNIFNLQFLDKVAAALVILLTLNCPFDDLSRRQCVWEFNVQYIWRMLNSSYWSLLLCLLEYLDFALDRENIAPGSRSVTNERYSNVQAVSFRLLFFIRFVRLTISSILVESSGRNIDRSSRLFLFVLFSLVLAATAATTTTTTIAFK